ncbi:MAG: MotA/TolQ/ExbB proton channel family protein [Candidatus Omnitrophica bacterium]|nr:MotA/TolQ/ExbB proton channel family protein [Candidatus Omnitrophota bacterium]
MLTLFARGGIVMWPLLLLSFLAVTFIIERAIFFWRESLRQKFHDRQKILSNVEKGNFEEAERIAQKSKGDFVIRVLLVGLLHRNHSLARALETQSYNELRRMKKFLTVLDTAITAAPLLGILGTVSGIISSFDALGLQGISDPTAVTKGISEALITTAFGLIIALGTLFPYNIFQSQYQRAVAELESVCSVLEMIIEKLPEALRMTKV